jgi:peptidoglycan hydrolase CwlO-like protein
MAALHEQAQTLSLLLKTRHDLILAIEENEEEVSTSQHSLEIKQTKLAELTERINNLQVELNEQLSKLRK